MSYDHRPLRNIWTFQQCTTPVGAVAGDTWFNPCTGFAYSFIGGVWEDFILESNVPAAEAGYVMGGLTYITTVSKITFSTEVLVPDTALPNGRWLAAGANSAVAGYLFAGQAASGGLDQQVNRLTFASSTWETLAATTSTTQNDQGFGVESAVAAYTGGGDYSSTVVDRLDFSDDSMSVHAQNLPNVIPARPGAFNSNAAGYICGGYTLTNVCRIDYATGNVANITNLLNVRDQTCGFESLVAGYVSGGLLNSSTNTASIEKLLFATEIVSLVGSNIGVARQTPVGINSFVAGYTCSGGNITRIDRTLFSNDTTAQFGYNTVTNQTKAMGFENLH